MEKTKTKYLIALPSFPNAKGFCHPTILVSAVNENDAIKKVFRIKGDRVNIGDIKVVDYDN